MKNIVFIVLNFIFCTIITGCDPGGTISILQINGNSIVIPCGKVEIEASTTGGFIFNIRQKFSPTDTIIVYPDSLFIFYKKQAIPYQLWDDKKRISADQIFVIDEKTLNIDFNIEEGTTRGDTLFLIVNGYIYCNKVPVIQDTIKILIDKGFD